MKTSEVLYRAADLIEERGWQSGGDGWGYDQGTNAANAAPLCLEGAIAAALGKVANVSPDLHSGMWPEEIAACPAGQAVRDYLQFDGMHLYAWNDHYRRTAAEVIEVLRAAAVIEAAKETADERESVTA